MAEETPSPAEQLVDEYDAFPAEPKADAPPEKKTPAKDPATGRFLPKQAPAPAAPVAEELPVTTSKFTHSKLLTRQALELGASESDLAETPSEDLRLWIADQSNRRLAERQASKAPVETPAPKEVELGEWAQGLDEGLLGFIKGMATELRDLKQYVGNKEVAEQTNRAERAFAQDADVFGEGTLEDLDPNGVHMMRRNMAAAEIRRLRDQPGSFESKMKKIAAALRGDKPAPKPEAKPTNGHPRITKEQWDAGTVHKPTDREGAPQEKGLKLAKQTFVKGMSELRQDSGDEDEVF